MNAVAMKELVVVSGKGGTGKTSLVASFAELDGGVVMADCDVDAADLHLLTAPRTRLREEFSGGNRARIKPGHCTACGKCAEICRFDAIFFDGPGNGRYPRTFRVDPVACNGCGVCAWFCAEEAIEYAPVVDGRLFVSDTRFGPMVHAELGLAGENSGKLVSLVRTKAREETERTGRLLLVTDGPPGTGCPVIATVTNADMVLVVTEPGVSGHHDLARILDLAEHFSLPAAVVVNKWDINPGMTRRIEEYAGERTVAVAGRIRYDPVVTEAMIRARTVTEHGAGGASEDIHALWETLRSLLAGKGRA